MKIHIILSLLSLAILTNCNSAKKEETKEETTSNSSSDIDNSITYDFQIPEHLVIDKEIITKVKWQDKNGDNIVIFLEHDSKDDNASELHCIQYIISETSVSRVWEAFDYVKPMDTLAFTVIEKTIEVTDLDDNGIGEISYIYNKKTPEEQHHMLRMNQNINDENLQKNIEGKVGESLEEGDHLLVGFENTNVKFKEYCFTKWKKYVK